MGQAAEEEVSGEGLTGRSWEGGDRESNEVEEESSNKLLPTARRKGHREKDRRVEGRCRMAEMWGGRADPGPYSFPVWEG